MQELQNLIDRHGSPTGRIPNSLPQVILAKNLTPSSPETHLVVPMFSAVLQGAKRMTVGGKAIEYKAGRYLLVSVDLPVTAQITRASKAQPFLGLGMMLRHRAISELLLDADSVAARLQPPAQAFGVSDLTAELIDAMTRMLRVLDSPNDTAILAPLIEREILWRLLNGPQGVLLRQYASTESQASQIHRVTHWIKNHYTEPLRIEDLARMAGMSVTSFHRHFRAVTSLSPLQYQKQIRLQEARMRLAVGSEDVTRVGFSVGYESMSHFSREYRKLFGHPPGRDSARIRLSRDTPQGV